MWGTGAGQDYGRDAAFILHSTDIIGGLLTVRGSGAGRRRRLSDDPRAAADLAAERAGEPATQRARHIRDKITPGCLAPENGQDQLDHPPP